MMHIRKSTKAFLVALVLVAPHMEPWVAHAFGAERGVKWSRTSLGRDDTPDEIDPETGEVLHA